MFKQQQFRFECVKNKFQSLIESNIHLYKKSFIMEDNEQVLDEITYNANDVCSLEGTVYSRTKSHPDQEAYIVKNKSNLYQTQCYYSFGHAFHYNRSKDPANIALGAPTKLFLNV